MKQYETPEMQISFSITENIMTTSGDLDIDVGDF